MDKKKNILVIEDEAPIRDMIRFALCREFNLIDAENVAIANRKMADKLPDLILLDWMLPDKSGIEFIRELKRDSLRREIPIIMLTAKAEEINKIKGLETGADDYVTKPFSPRELIVRIKAVLRRGSLVTPEDLLYLHDLSINVRTCEVFVAKEQVKLTSLEYKLLYFFVTHRNKVYSRRHLLDYIWGGIIDIEDRTVDVQVKRLRRKLLPYGYEKWIQTVRGEGYKLSCD